MMCARRAEQVGDLSEEELLDGWTRDLPKGADIADVVLGIGDDCAVVQAPERGRMIVLKTDCVVRGIHFAANTPGASVGWKAVMRVASDYAAMGARPRHALLTLCLPAETSVAWVRGIYRGAARALAEVGASLVGGETSRTEGELLISLSMSGDVANRGWVGRGGGHAGDLLYVTGNLGGSIRGHHLRFRARLEEGEWLAREVRPRAMMDLSDGLAKDLPRMAAASGTGWRVGDLPARRGCTAAQAAGDGEDYELLFAVTPRNSAKLERAWPERFPNVRLTRIGSLEKPGMREGLPAGGWDHFGAKR